MPIFFLQFEAHPMPESEAFEESGGAFVNCWLRADSGKDAERRASVAVRENGWHIISVEEECREVDASDYADDEDDDEEDQDENSDNREYYEQALTDGECYVFHQWPHEALGDSDGVH